MTRTRSTVPMPRSAEEELASLRISCQLFAECLLSVRKNNTDEWMDYAAGAFSDLCDVLGTGDRFQYDGRDSLRKVRTGSSKPQSTDADTL